MCGIAGFVASSQEFLQKPDALQRMCDRIVYRGPDEEGLWSDGRVGLGMRRLSIIDLAGGSQPIFNEDRSILTVFNGEIYNFQELRTYLESCGHTFRSSSDTEVIVHLYEQLGNDFVTKLRGMFAIALYDKRRDKLLLVRDRFGKKPLHYALKNGVLYFGSEIKSILAADPTLAEPSASALMHFFYFGYVPDPHTAFMGIRKLPPAHWLEFTKGNISSKQYWDLPQFASLSISERECLSRMEAVLTEAVRLRMISDVPLGALLSGGVDSSLVVALMAKVSPVPIKTFTISFGEQDFNESKYAAEVARRFGTDHHDLRIEADLWDTFEKLSTILDEPFADSSVVPTYHVSRLARQYVTVVLSGDGGDELFAGYDRYRVQRNRSRFDVIPTAGRVLYLNSIYPRLPLLARNRKLTYNIAIGQRDRYLDSVSFISSRQGELGILSPEFIESAAGSHPEALLGSYFDNAPAADLVSRMQYCDIKTYMTGDVLTKVDRMSMAASLEVRSPLLDHVFAELAAQIPVKLKLQKASSKLVLKQLAEKLGVPRSVLYRKKQGFALPLVHWMRSRLRDRISAILTDPLTFQRGYFRPQAVERVLYEHFQHKRDHSHLIWQMLALELWHRNFLPQFSRDSGELKTADRDRLCLESR